MRERAQGAWGDYGANRTSQVEGERHEAAGRKETEHPQCTWMGERAIRVLLPWCPCTDGPPASHTQQRVDCRTTCAMHSANAYCFVPLQWEAVRRPSRPAGPGRPRGHKRPNAEPAAALVMGDKGVWGPSEGGGAAPLEKSCESEGTKKSKKKGSISKQSASAASASYAGQA